LILHCLLWLDIQKKIITPSHTLNIHTI